MPRAPIEWVSVEPDTLRADPLNRSLLDGMGECRDGTDAPEQLPWRVGRFNVTTHPDLVEYVADVAAAAGLRQAFVCGRPTILAPDDRILGWGRGVFDFVIRAGGDAAAEVGTHGGAPDERYGGGWLVFPAFLPDVPRADHVPTIARWLQAARDA
jgi:hypothetical protein